jgi:hypothetical protein
MFMFVGSFESVSLSVVRGNKCIISYKIKNPSCNQMKNVDHVIHFHSKSLPWLVGIDVVDTHHL